MKKFLILFLFVFASAALYAQAAAGHNTVQNAMRIFEHDGEEVITSFPSQYLKGNVKIAVVFPEGYKKSIVKYPTVYILGENLLSKSQIEDYFWKKANPKAIYVSILMPLHQPSPEQLGNFLALEVLPYFELNYKVSSYPEDRAAAFEGSLAIKGLEMLSKKGEYFKNAALLMYETTAMPALEKPLPEDVTIWAAGERTNMIRLQGLLEQNHLVFPGHFAYKFAQKTSPKNFWKDVNVSYLLNKDGRKIKKIKVYSEDNKLSLSALTSVKLWLDVKFDGGYEADYVPPALRTAPPLLNWSAEDGILTPIQGADTGTVTIFGKLAAGNSFAASFDIVK